jgi:hypothetical protein
MSNMAAISHVYLGHLERGQTKCAVLRQRSGGSRFEASPGKYFMSIYLITKRDGGGAQGEGPEFKPHYRTHKNKTHTQSQNVMYY